MLSVNPKIATLVIALKKRKNVVEKRFGRRGIRPPLLFEVTSSLGTAKSDGPCLRHFVDAAGDIPLNTNFCARLFPKSTSAV